MMRRLLYILLLGCMAVVFVGELQAAVEAEIETEKGFRDVVLVKIEDGQLFYRLPDAPEGVTAALGVDQIRSATFDMEYDRIAVFEYENRKNWVGAARVILKKALPTLPFLALPGNNAVEPAFAAGQYLERAAHHYRREGGEKREASDKIYEQAVRVLDSVAAADWNYLAEPAKLKAIGCRVMLGQMTEAERAFEQARRPEPYDGAFGQYWLTRGRLLKVKGEPRAACDALAKTVIFDSKNVGVFADALLLFGNCHEEITEYHRARDIYFELGRLFTGTEWGRAGIERLRYIMDNDLAADREKVNIAKVFFGREEDMNLLAKQFLDELEQKKDRDQQEGNGDD